MDIDFIFHASEFSRIAIRSTDCLLAYLDPGAGSMLLQVVIGVAAGIAFMGKMYWRSFLAFFSRKSKPSESEMESNHSRVAVGVKDDKQREAA